MALHVCFGLFTQTTDASLRLFLQEHVKLKRILQNNEKIRRISLEDQYSAFKTSYRPELETVFSIEAV